MDLNTALATAEAKGWQRDWTRASVAHQVSVERDGVYGFVKVLVGGLIAWSVSGNPDSPSGKVVPTRRGTAPSLDVAIEACEASICEATGTLF